VYQLAAATQMGAPRRNYHAPVMFEKGVDTLTCGVSRKKSAVSPAANDSRYALTGGACAAISRKRTADCG
jgi:hypothetical protein